MKMTNNVVRILLIALSLFMCSACAEDEGVSVDDPAAEIIERLQGKWRATSELFIVPVDGQPYQDTTRVSLPITYDFFSFDQVARQNIILGNDTLSFKVSPIRNELIIHTSSIEPGGFQLFYSYRFLDQNPPYDFIELEQDEAQPPGDTTSILRAFRVSILERLE